MSNPRVFPVYGHVTFSDTWGEPRSGGRAHKGVDIYADYETPVVAVEAGWATRSESPLGGRGVNITTSDGTRYYYAHLAGWQGTLPRHVAEGEWIGGVGDTGNAQGGPPHLHFEIHPHGGDAVNPFPLIEHLPQAGAEVPFADTAQPTFETKPKPKTKKEAPKEAPSSGVDSGLGMFLLFLLLAKGVSRGH